VTHLHVESYTVTFIGTHVDKSNNESTVSKTVTGVLRDYIKFADLPYTTDLHMMGTFRQPAGIPDVIFPDAWRNDIKKNTCTAAAAENDNEEDQNCQWDNAEEEEKDEEIDVDPCALYYDDHLRNTEDEQHSGEYIATRRRNSILMYIYLPMRMRMRMLRLMLLILCLRMMATIQDPCRECYIQCTTCRSRDPVQLHTHTHTHTPTIDRKVCATGVLYCTIYCLVGSGWKYCTMQTSNWQWQWQWQSDD